MYKKYNVRLIVNYFANNSNRDLKCEIHEYETLEEAENKIIEMKKSGIELGDSNFGFYEIKPGRTPIPLAKRRDL